MIQSGLLFINTTRATCRSSLLIALTQAEKLVKDNLYVHLYAESSPGELLIAESSQLLKVKLL